MKYWLGLDIGTSGSRALLVDENGRAAAGVTAPHDEMQMPKPLLWAEQRPEDWWRAAQQAIRGVLQEADVATDDVEAIGLSGQMHGLVLLDENHDVLRPAIIWCDQRCQDQVDWINTKAGTDMVLEQTANPVLTGFTAPKLIWVRDHDPSNYERVRHVLLPKDYIRFCLTGEFAGDASDSSGTALFDVVHRRWAVPLIEKLGIDRSILPRVVESPEVTGTVSEIGSEHTGLRTGTPVVGGAGDQAASAVGNGIVEPGLVSATIGTSGVIFSHLDQVAYDPEGRVHTFCHAVPGKWHVMGVTQGAGLSLQWFRNQLGQDAVVEAERRNADPYEILTEEAAQAPAGSEGLYWLPYLMGERSPHLDAHARGGWIGLTARHTRAHLIRSVIEGVSYSLQDCLGIVASLGAGVKIVRASGGGARSELWRRILASVFDVPIAMLESQEGSAYGAALLSMVGSGRFGSVEEACRTAIQECKRIEPDPDWRNRYAADYPVFQRLYPALNERFPEMSG